MLTGHVGSGPTHRLNPGVRVLKEVPGLSERKSKMIIRLITTADETTRTTTLEIEISPWAWLLGAG